MDAYFIFVFSVGNAAAAARICHGIADCHKMLIHNDL
jgi:hypothetical protein